MQSLDHHVSTERGRAVSVQQRSVTIEGEVQFSQGRAGKEGVAFPLRWWGCPHQPWHGWSSECALGQHITCSKEQMSLSQKLEHHILKQWTLEQFSGQGHQSVSYIWCYIYVVPPYPHFSSLDSSNRTWDGIEVQYLLKRTGCKWNPSNSNLYCSRVNCILLKGIHTC